MEKATSGRLFYSLYEISLDFDAFPRSDSKFGNTCHMQLISDYFDSEGDLPNLLAGSNADFIYISFPTSFLPAGNEIDTRTKIEDVLNTTLTEHKTGRCIGSAFGTLNNYIDFIIFDGSESLEVLVDAIKNTELPEDTEIHYWEAQNETVIRL